MQGTVERHSITLTGANVELQPDATLAGAIPPSQRKFFVAVPATRLEPAGSVAVQVDVIPRSMASTLGGSGTLTAMVSAVGDYSGSTVVSAARGYPIEICSFCLSGTPAACPPGGILASTVLLGECIPSQAIDSYSAPGGGVDINTVGMEFSFILTQVRKATEILEVGGVSEVTIRCENLTIIIRVVSKDYFLALAIKPDGNFGKGRYLLRVVAPKMQSELV
jgi:predicted regulator of Ras-like GTPase activity (Roadblock/LC7/MglB family)